MIRRLLRPIVLCPSQGLHKPLLQNAISVCTLNIQRPFAKNAKAHNHNGKRKDAASHSQSSVSSGEEFDLDKHEQHMQKIVDHFKQEMLSMRMGVATPHLLDGIKVDTPEGKFTISQLGQVVVKDRQTLQVIVPDTKICALIDKAIKGANLNLNPQHVDSHILRIPIPKMSQEYRQTLQKQVHQMGENQKVKVRQERQNARNHLKKHPAPSKDDNRKLDNMIQELTEKSCKLIEDLEKQKLKEIQNN